MEIKLAGNLNMETDIPILHVENFDYVWKPNSHALLKLNGYLDRNIQFLPDKCYNSRIKVWLEDKKQIIYHGYIVNLTIRNAGGTSQVWIEAMTASCHLDRRISSSSFQNTGKTYGEIVREAVQIEGGQVIRNRKSDKEISIPVIRYEETAWEFAKRMSDRLGTFIIPDVETGNPNLWFGMRKGKEVPPLKEEQCIVQMEAIGKQKRIRIQAEGRDYYKIGDSMSYMGQNVTIAEVEGHYEHGELFFTYILEDRSFRWVNPQRGKHKAGMGLWGTIEEIKEETVKLVLDIDHGKDTGDYFFPYYPETGNALYAMPEKGARALLYFFEGDEQQGAVIHCLNKEAEDDRYYKDRALDMEDGNSIRLSKETVSISRGGSHMTVDDDTVSVSTSKEMNIRAEGKIRLRAKRINISTPDELTISQG